MEEIDDQTGIINDIIYLHLKNHGGVIKENCPFCQNFIVDNSPEDSHSFKLVWLDFSEEKH